MRTILFPEQIVRMARAGVLPSDVTTADVAAAYDAADRGQIDAAAARFRTTPGRWDAVRMDCFGSTEADRLRAYAEEKHPDIRWIFPESNP